MIVFYGTYAGEHDQKAWLIVAALGIATLSGRFVETPIRSRKDQPRRAVAFGATLAASTGAVATLVVLMAGFPERLPEELRGLSSDKEMTQLQCTEFIWLQELRKNCVVGVPWANATKRGVLWGDSHARHFAPLLDIVARKQGLSLVLWRGCPPFIDNDKIRRNPGKKAEFSSRCGQSRRQILDWLEKSPGVGVLIIANRWAAYPDVLYEEGIFDKSNDRDVLTRIQQGLDETLAEIDPQRRSILLIDDVPFPAFRVPDCALQNSGVFLRRPCQHGLDHFSEFERPMRRILAAAASGTNRIYYIDPVKAMCGPEGCPLRVNGEIIYADAHHLRGNLKAATYQQLVSMLQLDETLRWVISKVPPSEHVEIPVSEKRGVQ